MSLLFTHVVAVHRFLGLSFYLAPFSFCSEDMPQCSFRADLLLPILSAIFSCPESLYSAIILSNIFAGYRRQIVFFQNFEDVIPSSFSGLYTYFCGFLVPLYIMCLFSLDI